MANDLLGDATSALLNTHNTTMNRRIELLASNLANADTPGYKAMDLNFAQYLQHVAGAWPAPPATILAVTHPSHFPVGFELPSTVALRLIYPEGLETGNDGNNVDADQEMAKLAETGLRSLAGTQLLQARFRLLRAAIREGR